MILLQSSSRHLLQILSTRLQNLEKGVELDCQWVEFDDVRYYIQANVKNPNLLFLSVSIPTPPPETTFVNGLPPGAIEAIKATYGVVLQILDPPRDGFNLTVKLSLLKLPADEEHKQALLVKISSIQEVVLGAPLRAILNQFFSRTVRSDLNQLVSFVHRPNEAFFIFLRQVTLIFPMHFRDSVNTVLATSFLQNLVHFKLERPVARLLMSVIHKFKYDLDFSVVLNLWKRGELLDLVMRLLVCGLLHLLKNCKELAANHYQLTHFPASCGRKKD